MIIIKTNSRVCGQQHGGNFFGKFPPVQKKAAYLKVGLDADRAVGSQLGIPRILVQIAVDEVAAFAKSVTRPETFQSKFTRRSTAKGALNGFCTTGSIVNRPWLSAGSYA